jgi:hypothetical protein
LLPKSKYPHLENNPSDWVLSCRLWNALKALWDPHTDGGKQIYFDGSLTKEQRQILIQRVKDYLRPLRECLDTRFHRGEKATTGGVTGRLMV